jgi:hypothetical protein
MIFLERYSSLYRRDIQNEWLTDGCYYMDINNTTSTLFDLLLGTVQGLILGQILYALFVSPFWDQETFRLQMTPIYPNATKHSHS